MTSSLPTHILRHKKENKKKCSLKGLQGRTDFIFYTYPQGSPSLIAELSKATTPTILLTIDAPPLSLQDSPFPLLLIDGTWRYAQQMEKKILSSISPSHVLKRSLPPHVMTAYPRAQTGCLNPDRGLASIEALFVAYFITGRPTQGLLEGYFWKNAFLEKNPFLQSALIT